jgi:hypothetical protein
VQAAREQIRSSYDFALHMSHERVISDGLSVDLLRRFALAGTESRLAENLHGLAELPVDEIVLVIMGRDPVAQAARLNRLAGAVAAGWSAGLSTEPGGALPDNDLSVEPKS